MMMIHQLKAARALLDWTQQDLARASSMHLNVINNIERGTTNPRQKTIEKLKKTLEDQGIAFIGMRGVELVRQAMSVKKIERSECINLLFDDIKHSKIQDICSIVSDLKPYDTFSTQAFKKRIITRMKPDFYPRNPEHFRMVDLKGFNGTDIIIYGHHTAFVDAAAQEIVVLKSAAHSQSQRAIFEALWLTGIMPVRIRARDD
jgi:transcriptional regulator with XRE-family HTH domain